MNISFLSLFIVMMISSSLFAQAEYVYVQQWTSSASCSGAATNTASYNVATCIHDSDDNKYFKYTSCTVGGTIAVSDFAASDSSCSGTATSTYTITSAACTASSPASYNLTCMSGTLPTTTAGAGAVSTFLVAVVAAVIGVFLAF